MPSHNNKNTCPDTGSLHCWINSTLNHLSKLVDKNKNTQCQLHMQVARADNPEFNAKMTKPAGAWAYVMHCPTCHVHLCTECFSLFHKEAFWLTYIDLILCKYKWSVTIINFLFTLNVNQYEKIPMIFTKSVISPTISGQFSSYLAHWKAETKASAIVPSWWLPGAILMRLC